MKDFIMEAQSFQEELVEIRRYLHQNPELGMDTPITSSFIKTKLEEMGYAPEYCAGTGVLSLVGGKKGGKVILLRADLDALPITEETDVEYKSTNGCMHACGHDFHTTMLLGAAKLLKQHEDELEGTVKLMFQPAEEIGLGAKSMIAAGVLENPKVDAAVMFHVGIGIPAPPGLLIVPDGGVFSAALDSFHIDIKGKGGHGAMPEAAVDPLIVASHVHLALQTIRSREIAGGEDAVVTIGLMKGGMANNVIPVIAHMEGTIRTFDPKIREFIHERIKDISEGIARSFRAEAEVKIINGCPSVINDDALINDIRSILTDTFGVQAVPPVSFLGMSKLNGSEDFSFVTEQVPSAMLIIMAGDVAPDYKYAVHHPKVLFNEKVLSQGAAAYAAIAYDWLKKNKG